MTEVVAGGKRSTNPSARRGSTLAPTRAGSVRDARCDGASHIRERRGRLIQGMPAGSEAGRARPMVAPGDRSSPLASGPYGTLVQYPSELGPVRGCAARSSRGMPRGTVFVVDDDPSVRRALHRLIRAAGFDVESFADGAAYLASRRRRSPACLVLDIRMPGMTGFELQSAIAGRHRDAADRLHHGPRRRGRTEPSPRRRRRGRAVQAHRRGGAGLGHREGARDPALMRRQSALANGISRSRFPVRVKIAFASAGAIGGTPGSPTPACGARLSTSSTCVLGASKIRTSG